MKFSVRLFSSFILLAESLRSFLVLFPDLSRKDRSDCSSFGANRPAIRKNREEKSLRHVSMVANILKRKTYGKLPWQFCNFNCKIINESWNFAPKLRSNREEKSLRHVSMVAKFLDDKKPKKSLKNVYSHYFKLHLSYSVSFNLANPGEIFFGTISNVI